jgi:acyl carrier protein
MKHRLAQFIARDLLNRTDLAIADDTDLLASGLLDSLSVMSLVVFMEEELAIQIPPEDIAIEHFESLAAIETYLIGRGAVTPGGDSTAAG